MESANLQHQLQELFGGYSSLVSAPRTASITNECSPNIILDGNSYHNPYLVDQSLQCSSRENENVWFNFSSNYQQQPNDQQQLSTLYSSVQSPASYGGFQGISAGSNTNYYTNNVFSSSSRNNNNNNTNNSSTSTLDLLSSSSFSSSMGYNLQAADHHLDFLSTSNYSSGFNKNRALFGYAHQHHPHHHHVQVSINDNSPSNSSNKTSPSSVVRAKRPVNSLSEPKKSNSPESKKPCSASRSSFPPLKVRKEKLGDRISALQRLVAPFGKTDTSSVLTEAIGYIQFLHDQVEGSIQEDGTKPRQDLRSRGLCLMPLSCASFIHGYD